MSLDFSPNCIYNTESITHDIIPLLVSRCKIHNLHPLAGNEVKKIVCVALNDVVRGLGNRHLEIEKDALDYLTDVCNGDVGSALNALDVASYSVQNEGKIDLDTIQQAFQFRLNGTTTDFYDLTSTFIKSMRGRHTDAAISWLARMLNSGVAPIFIARRVVVQAAEAVIFVTESPKSDSAYKAINSALKTVKNTSAFPIPSQLKNSSGL
ncbi:MAG: ATPase [Firmicutes bacterium]|nr:ATPase [Bacillota bacterium]